MSDYPRAGAQSAGIAGDVNYRPADRPRWQIPSPKGIAAVEGTRNVVSGFPTPLLAPRLNADPAHAHYDRIGASAAVLGAAVPFVTSLIGISSTSKASTCASGASPSRLANRNHLEPARSRPTAGRPLLGQSPAARPSGQQSNAEQFERSSLGGLLRALRWVHFATTGSRMH